MDPIMDGASCQEDKADGLVIGYWCSVESLGTWKQRVGVNYWPGYKVLTARSRDYLMSNNKCQVLPICTLIMQINRIDAHETCYSFIINKPLKVQVTSPKGTLGLPAY